MVQTDMPTNKLGFDKAAFSAAAAERAGYPIMLPLVGTLANWWLLFVVTGPFEVLAPEE